jgi:hypothetical protein
MTVGELKDVMRDAPDDFPIHLYIGEDELQAYLVERYICRGSLGRWQRWLLRRWLANVRQMSGMWAIGLGAWIHKQRPGPRSIIGYYPEYLGIYTTAVPRTQIAGKRKISAGQGIVRRDR